MFLTPHELNFKLLIKNSKKENEKECVKAVLYIVILEYSLYSKLPCCIRFIQIYNKTRGISSANYLIQIMNIGKQLYSYLMQSELQTVLNVFDTGYQLEYSESYSGTVNYEMLY